MRYLVMLALAIPATAVAQSSQRSREGPFPAAAGTRSTPEQTVSPRSSRVPTGLPHAVKVGFTVYVSAMVPVDSAGRLVGPNDLAAQTRQVLANLAAVMRAARGVPGDVVRLTIYLRDLTPEGMASVRSLVLDALDRDMPPALTVIGVSALPEPEMKVMVDATAQLRSEFPDKNRMKKP